MPPPVTLEQIDEVRWRVPQVGAMRVEGRIYADEGIARALLKDPCVSQVANVAALPGIVGAALAMPDIHWGYGFPIGGVAAFDPDRGGVVSPGGVGYDINCGVRLHRTSIDAEELVAQRDRVADEIQLAVPAGVGVGRREHNLPGLDAMLAEGPRVFLQRGWIGHDELPSIEDRGQLEGAEPDLVSKRARERGLPQLGTLGSGNHFLELDRVAEVYDPALAERFGLLEGAVTLLVHSGSRGLGHAVCEETLPAMMKVARREGITLPDKQLACAPLSSPEAERYLAVMAAAANFAFCNRALIAHRALNAMAKVLGVSRGALGASLLYDVCHNIAKYEEHEVEGARRRLCVHRKGATRAFGPGHPLLPARFRETGQPVIIPGDMGRYSFVMAGAQGAMDETFGSACHGAGRLLSRSDARDRATPSGVVKSLREKGIALRAASVRAVVEEMPDAYKDVADVVQVIERAGIARRVARLEPVIVVKG